MFINQADVQLFAVDFGCAPRTLLAQGGWAGNWELWAPTFAPLSKTWRVIGYDHRGAGATVAPVESITFDALVDDVLVVLDAFAIDRCVLAAESAGAAVAVQAAVRYPDRIEALVLVDGLYHRERSQGNDMFAAGLKTRFEATIARFVDMCVPEHEADVAAVRRWGCQILARSGMDAAVRLFECMYGIDVRPLAATIRQPALLIHGDGDVIAPPAESEWMAGQIAHSRLSVLSGAGHVPTITRAADVAGLIDEFFAVQA